MKITRLLSLIVIVVALVGLTGCDDILEAFYPEFGDQGGDGQFEIGIDVAIDFPEDGTFADPMIGAYVEDINTNDPIDVAFIWPFWNWDENGDVTLTGYIDFFGIPDGEYRVIVWLERTGEDGGNGYPDPGEPARDAEYETADGYYDTIFRFPNAADRKRIEASAFLSIFEGEPKNHDFKIFGDGFVLDVDDSVTTKQFSVEPWDPELSHYGVNWRIVGRDTYAWYAEQYIDDQASTWPYFDVNLSTLPEGDYWLEVDVFYDDGWVEPERFPIRKIDEAGDGTDYDIDVAIYSVTSDPWYLDSNTTYQIMFDIFDGNGTNVRSGDLYVAPNEFGDLIVTIPSHSYNRSGGLDDIDWLQLVIDFPNGEGIEGTQGPEDLYLVSPLALSLDESGDTDPALFLWFDKYDLRPVFDDGM